MFAWPLQRQGALVCDPGSPAGHSHSFYAPSQVRNTSYISVCSLLYYVHLKNYIMGKTTNERFAKKAQASFSEAGGEGEGTTTYMDGKSETES